MIKGWGRRSHKAHSSWVATNQYHRSLGGSSLIGGKNPCQPSAPILRR